MKIFFLMQDTRGLYGAERASLQLVAGLTRAGIPVRVLLLEETRLAHGDGDGRCEDADAVADAAAATSPLAAAFRALAPVSLIPVTGRISRAAIQTLRGFVAAAGPGALMHSTGYKADVHAVLASRSGKRFPVISTVHGWLFRRELKERLFQEVNLWALRRCARVIVLSEFYERYMRHRGFSPLQLARIPTAFPAERIPPAEEAAQLWENPNALFTFGMLGRLSTEKDHQMLLRAARRLEKRMSRAPRPWRIWMAGDGPLRGPLQRSIQRSGLADRITLAGPMDANEFFRKTHVLVQCSRVENQPMSVMEAMAWGRPVLATRAGGLPEWVTEGEAGTGRLVKCGDASALAAAMQEVLMAPERAREWGAHGRAVCQAASNVEEMIREHIGLYEAEQPSPRI